MASVLVVVCLPATDLPEIEPLSLESLYPTYDNVFHWMSLMSHHRVMSDRGGSLFEGKAPHHHDRSANAILQDGRAGLRDSGMCETQHRSEGA